MIPLRQRRHRGIADRPVAGAPTEIAAQLVADLARLAAAIAVVGLEQRDDEARRTVAAL
ncbi:MAG: hypothetical protein WDM96_10860 [Lacunisphaera sp.]